MFLFLTGWPACGASFYGDWLGERYGFHHFDVEDPAAPQDLQELWTRLNPSRAAAFARSLKTKHPRWVISASVPTDKLARLEGLRAAGFSLWFLQARNESLSRQCWLAREREIDPETRPSAWEKQADAIRTHARSLRPYFRDHCVETLHAGLELMDGDAFAARVGVASALDPA